MDSNWLMIAIQANFLSEVERIDLRQVVRRTHERSQITRHANIILLLDEGKKAQEIAAYLFLDESTIYRVYNEFVEKRTRFLRIKPRFGRPQKLEKTHHDALVAHLKSVRYTSAAQLIAYMAKNYQLSISKSAALVLFKRLGFTYKKTKILSPCASIEKQTAMIAHYQALKANLPDDQIIVQIDAVHPTHMAKSGHIWTYKGEEIAVSSNDGRKRINIHGAIDLKTGDFTFMENETVNAQSTVQLLQKLLKRYDNKNKIHIYWDNARYHYSKEVQKFIADHGQKFEIHALPAYCPHLNPIERLWHKMHDYVTRNRHYPTYKAFCQAILSFFRETLPNEWNKIKSYVTDNFRVNTPFTLKQI